jgi:predicted outer membrane repeat protein
MMRWILLLLWLPLGTGAVRADTYVVRPDGSGDYPTIQAAVNAAEDGDVIELADGSFTGVENRDITFLGKAITVKSQSGNPDACVIDCEGDPAGERHRGFAFVSGEGPGATVEGITIANGYAPLISMDDAWGGGIFCDNGSSPTIIDCVLQNNEALGWPANGNGGGVASRGASRPSLIRCQFMQNMATKGGGALGRFALLEDCRFSDNEAMTGAGAVVFGFGSHSVIAAVVSGCTFTRNSASYRGGGLYCGLGACVISGSTFCLNSADDDGGSIACRDGRLEISGTVVAFSSRGEAVFLGEGASAFVMCSDLFGNAGGDWTGQIEDQLEVNGNICEDPLFCDPEYGDFTLHEDSPCAPFTPPNEECDLIGAWPVGCGPTAVRMGSWGAIKAMYRR